MPTNADKTRVQGVLIECNIILSIRCIRKGGKMNNTKIPTSLDSTNELKKLIVENPDLPLLIFVGEEAYSGMYAYNSADAHGISIKELTLYNDMYVDRDDIEDELSNDLSYEEEFEKLSDEEYEKMIKRKISQMEFIKAIIVHVG
jgi:hypothetical protein